MKRILVVEDEKFLANAIHDKLKHEGYEVIHAENGQVGLDMALSEKPDCILLDIVMPVMDGITMLKQLRLAPGGEKIPVILLSNLSDSHTAIAAVDNGVTDYLVKSDWKLADVIVKIEEATSDK